MFQHQVIWRALETSQFVSCLVLKCAHIHANRPQVSFVLELPHPTLLGRFSVCMIARALFMMDVRALLASKTNTGMWPLADQHAKTIVPS